MSQTSPFRRLRLAALGVVAVVAAVAFAAGADAQSKKKAAQPAPAAEAPKPAAVVPTSSPLALETTARQALIMDYNTGTILFEKNADERMPPSSMSKIMTAYMVFKAIRKAASNSTTRSPSASARGASRARRCS